MAYRVTDFEGQVIPQKAASQINACVGVVVSASQADTVLSAANATAGLLAGLSIATAASPGDPISVQVNGIGKAIAAASIGVGAPAGVMSASAGGLGPIASGSDNVAVGVSRTPAAAGEYFSVLLRPGMQVE